jgi:ABC-type lipoprotein export system ATPase subunit
MVSFLKKLAHRTGKSPAGEEPTNLIELRGVDKVYESQAGKYPALWGINLNINKGELVGIVGKSGSGKTTLLNMISGIDRPTKGEIWINSKPFHRMNEEQKTAWRGKNIGIVFQFFQLIPTLTVLENIVFAMDLVGVIPARRRKDRARMLLGEVDLLDHAGKLPSAVSGGQQQRVAIARALANDPPILIADEPTGNLDSTSAEAVFDLFTRQAAEGKTILLVTHDNDLALRMRRSIHLKDGKIVNKGEMDAIIWTGSKIIEKCEEEHESTLA